MSSEWDQSSTIQDESSTTQRDVGSFLHPRDPSITNPWMRPRPKHGTNLAPLFDEEEKDAGSNEVPCAHLRVFLRLKPTERAESLYSVQNDCRLVCRPPPENNPNTRNLRKTTDTYTFTHIFYKNESQATVFNKMIKDRLRRFIEGHDFTLMTYGASGSGKTYSLMGNDAQPGTIPRCLEFLFAQVSPSQLPRHKPLDDDSLQELDDAQQAREISVIETISRKCRGPEQDALDSYRRMSKALTRASRVWHQHHRQDIYTEVWVSFAEIYNESAFDLLQEGATATRLRIVQPPNNRPYLKDLSWVCVRSGLEAYAVLKRGRANLHYARTNVNATSSRSHCIFTMKLVQLAKDGKGMINTFRLCDLAGLERAKMTENSGERLNESKKINTSLHILERCLQAIRGLQGGQTSLPPYRESKLTALLQNPLSGREAVAMLVTVNPHRASYDETQHVLKFSALARSIVVEESKERALLMSHANSRVVAASLQEEVVALREEVATLRRELDVSTARRHALQQAAEAQEEEVAALEQALQDAELDCQYREQKVRIETADKFTVILDKSHQDWTERLQQDKSILEQQHALAIRRWESCVERLQEDLASVEEDNMKTLEENQTLREQLAEALARIRLEENRQKPTADCNWSTIDGNITLNISGDSLSGIVPLELSTVAPQVEISRTMEEDTAVTPIVQLKVIDHLIEPKQIEVNTSTPEDHLIKPLEVEVLTEVDLSTSENQPTRCRQMEEFAKVVSPSSKDQYTGHPQMEELAKVVSPTSKDQLTGCVPVEELTKVVLPNSEDQLTGCQVEELTKEVSPISEDQLAGSPQVEELTKEVSPTSEDQLAGCPQEEEVTEVVSPTSEDQSSGCPQVEVPPTKMITPTYEDHLIGPPQGELMAPPMQRYRVDAGAPLVECYFTDKKQKPDILDKENIGSARRKLFSRHRLDMLAAEPMTPLAPLQPRALQLEWGQDAALLKDSPDPIKPPPVLRPYSTRSKK